MARSIAILRLFAIASKPPAESLQLGWASATIPKLCIQTSMRVIAANPVNISAKDCDVSDDVAFLITATSAIWAETHVFSLAHLVNKGASAVFNIGTNSQQAVKESLIAVKRVTG